MKPRRCWTDEELAFVKANLNVMSREAIARALKRQPTCVRRLVKRLGLPAPSFRHKWTPAQVFELTRLAETLSPKGIAAAMGLKERTVMNKVFQLKLRFRTEVVSLEEASRRTGYHPSMLKRAKKGLRQEWVREELGGGRSRFTITKAQLESLCKWLRNH